MRADQSGLVHRQDRPAGLPGNPNPDPNPDPNPYPNPNPNLTPTLSLSLSLTLTPTLTPTLPLPLPLPLTLTRHRLWLAQPRAWAGARHLERPLRSGWPGALCSLWLYAFWLCSLCPLRRPSALAHTRITRRLGSPARRADLHARSAPLPGTPCHRSTPWHPLPPQHPVAPLVTAAPCGTLCRSANR